MGGGLLASELAESSLLGVEEADNSNHMVGDEAVGG